MFDDTDFSIHDHGREDQSIPMTGPAATGSTMGNKYEDKLNGSQPDNVPPGLAWSYPQSAPAVPTPAPDAPAPAPVVDPNKRHTELLNSALAYARMGWPVIPCTWIWEHAGKKRCSCNKEDCDSPGKHPIGKLAPHGFKDATTDPETIRKWWERFPNANIAVVTGEVSGIVAIDLDIKDGKDGLVALEKWCRDNGVAMPETIIQQTGSGGFHYLFRYPAGLDIHGATDVLKNDSGIDVRGQNGYIMVEPSCNANGPYSWIDGEPWESEIADLPPKLLELIGGRKKPSAPAGAGVAGTVQWVVVEETVLELVSALEAIPSDNRDLWIKIGLAIKAMGLGERGFQIWDEWSSKSKKYNQSDMNYRWKTLNPDGRITYLSIFKLAILLGWESPLANSTEVMGAPDLSSLVIDSASLDGIVNYETGEIDMRALGRQYNAAIADVEVSAATVEIDLDQVPVKEPAATAMESIEGGIPNELLRFPVEIMNKTADWMESRNRDTHRQLTNQSVLALFSTASGRVYRSTEKNRTALFLGAIANSSFGKNYLKEELRRVLKAAGLEGLSRGSGYTSPGAMFSTLYEAPTHITVFDELGNKLAEARRQKGGELKSTFELLKEAFSDVDGTFEPKNYSTMGLTKKQRGEVGKRSIECPSITILGLSTPDQFFSEIKYSEIEGGFLNRLLIVMVDDDPRRNVARGMRVSNAPVPDEVVERIQVIRRYEQNQSVNGGLLMAGIDTPHDEAPLHIDVTFDQDAFDLYDDFYFEQKNREDALRPERLDQMVGRWREIAMRIGTIFAVAENPHKPVIRRTHADWAIKYVRYHGERLIERVRTKVFETEHENQQNIFLDAIMKAGRDGVTESEMNRNRPFKAQKIRDRQEIMATLAAGGLIKKAIIKKGGRPREAWVHFRYAPKQ